MVLLSVHQLHSLVPKRNNVCCKRSESFLPDSEYFSFLTLKEKGWQREDFCPKCWKEVGSEKRTQEGIEWQGKIPKKKVKSISSDDKAHLLFQDLYNEQSEENSKLLYVLALYLERKKQFQIRGSVKNKLCIENPDSGEAFAIEKLKLSTEELDQTVARLLDKLNE